MDSFALQADGSFSYSGNLAEPGELQIGTRNSTCKIWLDTSLKKVYLSEKPNANGRMILKVDSVIGSEDTYLYYYILQPRSIETGRTKINRSFYSQKEMDALSDSLRKVTKPQSDSFYRVYCFRIIDSVFKTRPDSRVLPWLITYYAPAIGIESMQGYYYRLSAEQQQSGSGKRLLMELNKLQSLKPGSYFNDFSMNDDQGRIFQLSSLKSKYVLIDFWASWCAPCRAVHPTLRDLYSSYQNQGFEIVAISLDEDKANWLEAIKQENLVWINLSELKGRNNSIALKYKITGIPYSILLDQNRKILLVNPTTSELKAFFTDQIPR